MTVTLLLGGARSGKSSLAVRSALAAQQAGRGPVLFVATGAGGDAEMAERIARHRAERPADWITIEAPTDLAKTVDHAVRDHPNAALIVDCLSLWVSNRLLGLVEPADAEKRAGADQEADPEAELEADLDEEIRALTVLLSRRSAPSWIVSNEVGSGLVPMHPVGRQFRDLLGRVNAAASRAADNAVLVVAGRGLPLHALDTVGVGGGEP